MTRSAMCRVDPKLLARARAVIDHFGANSKRTDTLGRRYPASVGEVVDDAIRIGLERIESELYR